MKLRIFILLLFFTVILLVGCSDSPINNQSSIPLAPDNLTAQALSSSSIYLTWNDNSSNEIGFKIFRSSSPGGGFAEIDSVPANSEEYTDSGLSPDSTYYYQVIVWGNDGGASSGIADASTDTAAVAVPVPPSSLEAVAESSSKVTLTWNDNSNDETGFRVYYTRPNTPW